MTGPEAIAALEGIGARLALRPDGLIDVVAPERPELDPLLDELRQHRAEAIAVLRARENVLPLPPERPRRAIPADSSSCPACHGTTFWISLAMVRICERCHPPADPRIVARRETATPASKGIA